MSTASRSPLSSNPVSSATPFSARSYQRQATMSITATYYLAHTARGKLAREASRSDHRLNRLVGHANLLDSLMIELSQAEQKQELWLRKSAQKTRQPEPSKHGQWVDVVDKEAEIDEEWQAADADLSNSDSDYDSDEDISQPADVVSVCCRPISQNPRVGTTVIRQEQQQEKTAAVVSASLHIISTPSVANPPELDDDSDSSEDEPMPPSPPSTSLPSFTEKEQQQMSSDCYHTPSGVIPASEQQAFFDEGFYLPRRPGPSLISEISVY